MGDDGARLPERLQPHFADVSAIEKDRAGCSFVDSEQQDCQRGLAGTGAADNPDLLAVTDELSTSKRLGMPTIVLATVSRQFWRGPS